MVRMISKGFQFWPDETKMQSLFGAGAPRPSIQQMYEMGYAGAWRDDDAKREAQEHVKSQGFEVTAEAAIKASDMSIHDGEGKLILLFPAVEMLYPGCWPGAAQEIGDCVSHSSKNGGLTAVCNEIAFGKPDEITGYVEGKFDISAKGITQGVLSTEFLYWWRGSNSDGWDCWTAAKMIQQNGILIRKEYPDLGIDLTEYSGSLAHKYGSKAPPSNIATEGRLHVVRTVAECNSLAEIRAMMSNGYGIASCGDEGFTSTRDENGVSARSGSWSHALAYLAIDDRPETILKYGCALILICNSWGPWNKGGRRILGTQIDIPIGTFWAKWNDIKNRQVIAYSSVAGWRRKQLPDYGMSLAG